MPWPTILHKLIGDDVDDYWRDVIERVKNHPHEAEIQGNFGQTALHVACYRYPPHGAVEAILKARPGCTLLVNRTNETPLHLATEHSSEDVQIAILKVGPEAAGMRDKYHDTPLHLACGSGQATEQFLRMLVEACPEAVRWKNKDGLTPIYKLPLKEENEEFEAPPELKPESQIFRMIRMLLFVAKFGSFEKWENGDRSFKEMHAVMSIQCPKDVILGVLRHFPEQALQRDREGMVPLAYAAKADIYVQPVIDDHFGFMEESYAGNDEAMHMHEVYDDGGQQQSENDVPLIDVLLSLNPRAAAIPDNMGRLPLHHAISSGKRWDEGVQSILSAAPKASQIKEEQGLYPFMLAATVENPCLQTCYNLLRNTPEVIQFTLEESELNGRSTKRSKRCYPYPQQAPNKCARVTVTS